ncbi:MAG: bifunctional 4-hydroxy-2-oxoglutarate aldolase/2-dehydro-3-deoxy-phosphogluconate aldolase [Spirochaetes bacterium]|nr:bifunctional 4-hydroxy-2-oxoglutarate aldolase/2-dehydro-3-deoxy-phosphogluconate aldolase [Spirochaetota bacterium]
MADKFASLLNNHRVIPVARFDGPDPALRTAELLQSHSFGIIEITLRTDAGIESIRRVSAEFPGLVVGAGSVLAIDSMKRARDAGASFCVAPGLDVRLLEEARAMEFPFMPGAATPTELNAALAYGEAVKIFPVSLLGGAEYIRAISAPFASRKFHLVPTGGVTEGNYLDYLKLDRVISVGMSYLVDPALVAAGDFAALGERMKRIMTDLER